MPRQGPLGCRVKHSTCRIASNFIHAASQYIAIRNASTRHMRVTTVAGTAGPRQSSARCGVGLPTRTREYTRANTLAIPYQCHTSTNLKFASYYLYPFSNNLNMTIISNDPSWWPIINAYRLSSNFAGSWRAVGDWSLSLSLTLTVISQLPPSLDWRMIGVSMIISKDFWYLTSIFSTYVWTRGMLMLWLEQPCR